MIQQRHLIAGMERVVDSKKVMAQSLFDDPSDTPAALPAWQQAAARSEERFGALDEDLSLYRRELTAVGGDLSLCRQELEVVAADVDRGRADLEGVRADVSVCRQEISGVQASLGELIRRVDTAESSREQEASSLREGLAALRAELQEASSAQARSWEERLNQLTLIRMPRWASVGLFLLLLAATGGLGWSSAAFHWLR
jgi:chromosome segregation ATPase